MQSIKNPQSLQGSLKCKQVCFGKRIENIQNFRCHADSVKYMDAGPSDPKISYDKIDNNLMNKTLLNLFRQKLVAEVGIDSQLPGYDGVAEIVKKVNTSGRTATEIQASSMRVLVSMFPSWIFPSFQFLFVNNFPKLSLQLNAIVTGLAMEWLMGETELIEDEINGEMTKLQVVQVKRCRYIEETGCASVCTNSCKIPTQEFFRKYMGLEVTLEPDYEDFSCKFVFGKTPLPPTEDDVFKTPCFSQCPSKKLNSRQECAKVVTQTICEDQPQPST